MLSIIVAIGKNNEIGSGNTMPWHLPEDLAYFKKTTLGHTMIMGRKTFESLPGVLPNRKHIVLSQIPDFSISDNQVEMCHCVDELIYKYKDSEEEVFVVGGGVIYKLFLPYCYMLYLTHIDADFECDTYFPEINYDLYEKMGESVRKTDEKSDISYCQSVYKIK